MSAIGPFMVEPSVAKVVYPRPLNEAVQTGWATRITPNSASPNIDDLYHLVGKHRHWRHIALKPVISAVAIGPCGFGVN